MTSMRETIRKQCKTLLIAGDTAAGTRVFTSRIFPIWKLSFPVISIFTLSEEATILGTFPTISERKLRVVVQLIDGNIDTDVEDKLDSLAEEVEGILNNDDNWQLTDVSRIEYVSSEMDMANDREADKNYITATMNFDVYYIHHVSPVAPPDTAYVEINNEWIPETPPDPPT